MNIERTAAMRQFRRHVPAGSPDYDPDYDAAEDADLADAAMEMESEERRCGHE